ncbi:MAG: ribosomal L7Ae/L30e/S12e/Gadd45 family protein [Candidatus Woesearchaeota archaeon]
MAKITAEDIKKLIQTHTVTYGTNEVLRSMRSGKVSKVYLASNVPQSIEDDFTHNAKITTTEVEKLDIPNDELGLIFKRIHPILAVGVMKE